MLVELLPLEINKHLTAKKVKYRLTKISTPENPQAQSASSIDEYRSNMSRNDGFSPPVDYYVEGESNSFPSVGNSFMMVRDNRNGVKVYGTFQSSPVTEIYEEKGFTVFATQNSIYKLEILDRNDS